MNELMVIVVNNSPFSQQIKSRHQSIAENTVSCLDTHTKGAKFIKILSFLSRRARIFAVIKKYLELIKFDHIVYVVIIIY